jgi:CO/xanthine dehydrogenase Mo-binding subunit
LVEVEEVDFVDHEDDLPAAFGGSAASRSAACGMSAAEWKRGVLRGW